MTTEPLDPDKIMAEHAPHCLPWDECETHRLAAEVKTLRAAQQRVRDAWVEEGANRTLQRLRLRDEWSALFHAIAELDGAEHVPGCDLPDLHTGNCSVPLIALDSAE